MSSVKQPETRLHKFVNTDRYSFDGKSLVNHSGKDRIRKYVINVGSGVLPWALPQRIAALHYWCPLADVDCEKLGAPPLPPFVTRDSFSLKFHTGHGEIVRNRAKYLALNHSKAYYVIFYKYNYTATKNIFIVL